MFRLPHSPQDAGGWYTATAAMVPTAIIVPTLQEVMFQVGQALIPQAAQLQ